MVYWGFSSFLHPDSASKMDNIKNPITVFLFFIKAIPPCKSAIMLMKTDLLNDHKNTRYTMMFMY